jgi:hypothetical protein
VWKRGLILAAWFIGGAVLGVLSTEFLIQWWIDLGERKPVADWLVSIGWPWGTGYWGLVSLHLPDWGVMTVAGGILGWILRRRWLEAVLAISIGYVVGPWAWSEITEGETGLGLAWRLGVLWMVLWWDLLAMVVAVSTAAMARLIGRKRAVIVRPFPIDDGLIAEPSENR